MKLVPANISDTECAQFLCRQPSTEELCSCYAEPMIEIGRYAKLEVLRPLRAGFELGDGAMTVVLPKRDAPKGVRPGDRLEVFIVTDKDGNPQATTLRPSAELDGIVALEIVDTAAIGAFADWGLTKDLFIPNRLQREPLEVGDTAVVAVICDDRSGKLIGTTVLGPHLDYEVGDLEVGHKVDLLVYDENPVGTLVLVNGRHAGLVYDSETPRPLKIGEKLRGFITKVREDNKLDIRLQPSGKLAREDAVGRIMAALIAADGVLPLHDKSSPAQIKEILGLSKKAFKKGLGTLYRQRRVEFLGKSIRLID